MKQNTDSIPTPADFRHLKIIVAGDIMLDRYIYGEVTRVSPEGPVPVLAIKSETKMLGGAGNVLANLSGLSVETNIVAVIGRDQEGETIRRLCAEKNIGTEGLLETARPTIQKTRFVGNGQQMLRADCESVENLNADEEKEFILALEKQVRGANALILSDYGKGSLTKNILKQAIEIAVNAGVTVLVDPKGSDYSRYKNAHIVTPNRKELSEALKGAATATDEDMESAARKLLQESGIRSIVATRSADGMTILDNAASAPLHLKTQAREVFDVSGAGDTVIACLAAGVASGLNLHDAARLANKAAGIVVARAGTAAITAKDLSASVNSQSFSLREVKEQIRQWKAQGLKIGFTNGCFDILHAGHVSYLQEARHFCDRLIVGLNHDKSVRILKGPARPVNDEASRAIVLNALSCVDAVILFGAEIEGGDNTPAGLIEMIRPDIFFKGGDYREDQLPEAKIVRNYGGDVKIMGMIEGKSTTAVIEKISAA